MKKQRFAYSSAIELMQDANSRGIKLPWSDDLSIFFEATELEGHEIPNRLVVHPMEGCDASPEKGSPTELTYRRYQRFAHGGAGIIWVEATAVDSGGRSNPRQLWINRRSQKDFARLVEVIHHEAVNANGHPQRPFVVLQLTHSGRQSKPKPLITHRSRILDAKDGLPEVYPLISDEELEKLEDKFVTAAQLAAESGFDGVDIKACHGYLIHELLFSYTRAGSRYGGSFENRTRFIRNVVHRIKSELPALVVVSRLNIYDGIPYPWGWGTSSDGSPDLTEPVELIRQLKTIGIALISIAVGNPYYNPHLERPYDVPIKGGYIPDEHPLMSIGRIIHLTCQIHESAPEIPLIAAGFSWLRQFWPYVAAGLVCNKCVEYVGVGRGALAYPSFANELARQGQLDPKKVCITCSSCSQMMKDGVQVGCVVHDQEIYGPIYRSGRMKEELKHGQGG